MKRAYGMFRSGRSFRPYCAARPSGIFGLGSILLGAIVALASVGFMTNRK
jgi:hypothetical protein